MDATEKQILRAELLASGVIRYWKFIKAKDQLDRWLEVLGEALGELNGSEAGLKIRTNLLTYGLRVPEVRSSVHVDAPHISQSLEAIEDADSGDVYSRLPKADSNGLTVHPAATSDAQVQQNPNTSNSREVCGRFTNIYNREETPAPVHLPHVGDLKAQQNAAPEANESLGMGFTLAIPKKGQVPSKGPTGS